MDKIDLAFFGYIGTAAVVTAIAMVLVSNRDSWLPIVLSLMSRLADAARRENNNADRDHSPATTTPATSNNALQSDATYSKALLAGQARALAAMVKAGKIGETEGIKIVFGVSPSSTNARYQAARSALKIELERLNNPYPQRTEEQRRAREALGLTHPR
jgi:hypothetical protein